ARGAVEQFGRVRLPTLDGPVTLHRFLDGAPALVPHPTAAVSLRTALADADRAAPVRLLIGPEGGFSDSEVAACLAAGARAVTLGRRVLRSETAAVVAAALAAEAIEVED